MKIEFNKVTWYSKILALIVILGAIIWAFFLGRNYEAAMHSLEVVEIEKVVEVEKSLRPEGFTRSFTFLDNVVLYGNKVIEGANPKTLTQKTDWKVNYNNINNCYPTCYIYDEDQVWVYSDTGEEIIFRELDIENLDNFYIKLFDNDIRGLITDGERVFRGSTDFTGVNLEKITPIENSIYWVDDKNVYTWQGLLGADLSTFKIVDMDGRYAKDANNVYFKSEIIEELDPETLEVLNRRFFKDVDTVMYRHIGRCDAIFDLEIIESADPATFELVQSGPDVSFAKDKNYIYVGADPQTESDPSTVEYINHQLTDSTGTIYNKSLYGLNIGGC